MAKNCLSFLTPISNISNKQFILEKRYSQYLTLEDDSTLSFASNIGYKENQEDSLAISHRDNLTLLLVSDGLGGLESGELSSYNTAKIIQEWFETENIEKIRELDKNSLHNEILKLIYLILITIPPKSGTTLNMSIILPEKTLIVNIGDSRTYTLKDGIITLRTKDDSLAFKIFNPTTKKARDKLRFYKHNNIITEVISQKELPKITVTQIKNDDYDIICHVTDGVSDILSESEIEEFCQSPNPALTLVGMSIYRPQIKGKYYYDGNDYQKYIHPGKDNATAIIYTKKRTKNN